ERAKSAPDRPLFVALEGFFQARVADDVVWLRRGGWVNDAVAKLDRAVAREPGLPRYFRGLVLAELPARFGKAAAAVDDLQWVLDHKDRFPVGLRRSVYRGLAKAYTTLGREAEANAALVRSGYPSLDPTLPVFTTDNWVTAKDGFRFRPPRLVELAPRVYVAQGYDFADIAFVVTDDGIVAIDAGTTEANARVALAALRRITAAPITHVLVTHAHWDHIGGLPALRGASTKVVANARFADALKIVNDTGAGFRSFTGGALREHRSDSLTGPAPPHPRPSAAHGALHDRGTARSRERDARSPRAHPGAHRRGAISRGHPSREHPARHTQGEPTARRQVPGGAGQLHQAPLPSADRLLETGR